MGLFNKKRAEVVNTDNFTDPLLKALLADISIDREKALSIPAVSGYVDLICNTFAMIPFKLYKEEITDSKRKTKEVQDERVNIINNDTLDTLDGFQFKKAICEDYLMGKGGYAYIKKIGNKFKGLHYIEDKNITIVKNTDPIFKSFDFLVNGNKYKNYEFIKLLKNTKDGASGIGVTTEIAKALKTAFQRLSYEYDLTVTGGSRKGFIKSKTKLNPESMERLKQAWEQYYNGNANTVILNDGLEFQEASNTSKENEINQKTITFNDELKLIFHIGNNYNDFIKDAVMPIAIAFSTALNRDFLLEKEKDSYYFAPDTKELLKGSLKERYDAYRVAIQTGFKTRNEIRYMEDDDALDGLDMVSLGLGDVLLNTETGEIYTPNTNKIVKMGENSTEIIENPQENIKNDTKSTENEQLGDKKEQKLEENEENQVKNEKVSQ